MSSDRVRVFKRLETDEEFRARLKAAGHIALYSSLWLDDEAWNYFRMQRRIIEDQR